MESPSLFLYQLGGYAVKLAHVFGAIIWLGGVLFMAGVATPILNYYRKPETADPTVASAVEKLEERLVGFNWMGLWTVFISGFVLSLYSGGFVWFRFAGLTDWAIHLKIFLWLPIAMVNFLLSASFKELKTARREPVDGEDLTPRDVVEWRIVSLRRINVYLAFGIIILIALL
ncbi:MAG: hypothetical protein JWQ98_2512 [Chlorobi bacterium]|nr:hypothetical protein [Chlorobiota bacterium]